MENSKNNDEKNLIDKLKKYIFYKPIVIFDFSYSELMKYYSDKEPISFTVHKNETVRIRSESLCLLDSKSDKKLYMGIVSNKRSAATFNTKVNINTVNLIEDMSLDKICKEIKNTQLNNILKDRLPQIGGTCVLPPKLSEEIVNILLNDKRHIKNLLDIANKLTSSKELHPISKAENSAVKMSLKIFGLDIDDEPKYVAADKNGDSNLIKLYEDNVIMCDANEIVGFKKLNLDYTGKAEFISKSDNCQLTVFTANRTPIEEAFGVDLVYVNETQKNIVMVQYKMLEKANKDWLFRPDNQFDEQLSKMKIPNSSLEINDYRMCSNPFFFKFVKNSVESSQRSSNNSICLSLEHLNHYLNNTQSRSERGAIRVSYESLNGQYLRETEFVKLVQSGYIGTHDVETEQLLPIIEELSKGNRRVIVAWQSVLN